MAYFNSTFTMTTTANLPCEGYGNLLFGNALENDSLMTVDKATRMIPQHNLACFWNKPALYPVIAGFSMQTGIRTNSHFIGQSISRLPGPRIGRAANVKNSNLLASLITVDDAGNPNLCLYAINDTYNRKTLIENQLEFDDLTVEFNDVLQLKRESLVTKKFDLQSEALELRTCKSRDEIVGQMKNVFIRCEKELTLFDGQESRLDAIFPYNVSTFYQDPFLTDRVICLDAHRSIWYGYIGETFTERKTALTPELIAPTDTPPVILVSRENTIYNVDLRERSTSTSRGPDVLFAIPEAYFHESMMPDPDVDEIFDNAPERVCDMSFCPDRPYTTIATSSSAHYLLDHRMPGQEIVKMPHCVINGGDFSFVTEPFLDSDRNGFIYNYFTFSHSYKYQLLYWPFYLHANSSMWSSVGPMRAFDTPKILAEHQKLEIKGLGTDIVEEMLPRYARGVAYQKLPESITNHESRSLVFSLMDTGDLWYDNLVMDPSSDTLVDQHRYRRSSRRAVEHGFREGMVTDVFEGVLVDIPGLPKETQKPTEARNMDVFIETDAFMEIKGYDSDSDSEVDDFRFLFRPEDDPEAEALIDVDDLEIKLASDFPEEHVFTHITDKSIQKSISTYETFCRMFGNLTYNEILERRPDSFAKRRTDDGEAVGNEAMDDDSDVRSDASVHPGTEASAAPSQPSTSRIDPIPEVAEEQEEEFDFTGFDENVDY